MSGVKEVEPYLVLTRWAQKWLKFGWNIVIEGTPTEQIAKKILSQLDELVLEPSAYIEEHIDERIKLVRVVKKTQAIAKKASGIDVQTNINGEDILKTSMDNGKDESPSIKLASKGEKKASTTGKGSDTKEVTEKIEYEDDVIREVVSRKITQKLAKKQRSNFSAAVAKVAYNKFGERQMTAANIMVTRKWIQKYLADTFKDLRTCDKNIAIDRALFLSFVPTEDFLKMRIIMETKAVQDRLGGDSVFGRVFQLRRGDAPL